jgi:hypothetical protein
MGLAVLLTDQARTAVAALLTLKLSQAGRCGL